MYKARRQRSSWARIKLLIEFAFTHKWALAFARLPSGLSRQAIAGRWMICLDPVIRRVFPKFHWILTYSCPDSIRGKRCTTWFLSLFNCQRTYILHGYTDLTDFTDFSGFICVIRSIGVSANKQKTRWYQMRVISPEHTNYLGSACLLLLRPIWIGLVKKLNY